MPHPSREAIRKVLLDHACAWSEDSRLCCDALATRLLILWSPPDRAALVKILNERIGYVQEAISDKRLQELNERLIADLLAWAEGRSAKPPVWCEHWRYDGRYEGQEWRRNLDNKHEVVRKLTRFCDECAAPRPAGGA